MHLRLAHDTVTARLVERCRPDLARRLLQYPWAVPGPRDPTLLGRCLRQLGAELDPALAAELARHSALGAAAEFDRWHADTVATGGRPREGGRAALAAVVAWLQAGGEAGPRAAQDGAGLAQEVERACQTGPRALGALAAAQEALAAERADLLAQAQALLERAEALGERDGADLALERAERLRAVRAVVGGADERQ